MKDESGEEIPALAESDPICLAAVRDLNGDKKFAADGRGEEDGDGLTDLEEVCVLNTNLSGRGKIPVAILGSGTFDVLDVDVKTLTFGADAAASSHDLTKSGVFEDHLRDVNDDGLTDLISHYQIEDTGIDPDDAETCITGKTLDGKPFEGCDVIRAVLGGRRVRR